jgi:hypothetical protein
MCAQHWTWSRSHFLTFTLTCISLPKYRNCHFVTLSVTISRRFHATMCVSNCGQVDRGCLVTISFAE